MDVSSKTGVILSGFNFQLDISYCFHLKSWLNEGLTLDNPKYCLSTKLEWILSSFVITYGRTTSRSRVHLFEADGVQVWAIYFLFSANEGAF